MKRCWGYVRVSVQGDRSGESFISPDEQRRKINGWAQMQDVEIVDFKDDINVSGGKKSRPGLDYILERLENREADGIVVSNLDRLSRLGVSDALELIATIQGYGADIAIIEPSIDTSDPVTGEFVLTLFLALNRMERQRAKVRWAEAGENAIKRKIHTAQSPFGYMRSNEYDKDGNWLSKRDDREGQNDTAPRILVRHPTNAPIVKDIFRSRAAGESWSSIANRVNEMGSRSRLGRSGYRQAPEHRQAPHLPWDRLLRRLRAEGRARAADRPGHLGGGAVAPGCPPTATQVGFCVGSADVRTAATRSSTRTAPVGASAGGA